MPAGRPRLTLSAPTSDRRTRGDSVIGLYLRRIPQLTWKQALSAVVPSHFDVFLVQGDRESLAATPPVKTLAPLAITRYDADHKSGIPEVDEKLLGRTQGYVATVNGVVAHRVLLDFDYMRLRQLVRDSSAGMVIEAYTEPEFRCRGLQAFVQRHMLEDALSRGLTTKVCAEVRVDNLPSIKGISRGGLPVVARIQGVKILGRVYRRRVTPMSDAEAQEFSLRAIARTSNSKRLLGEGSLFRICLRRMRWLTLPEALRALIPTKYDTLLYQGDRESLAAVPSVTPSLPLVVGHYDKSHKSGIPDVDCRLKGPVEGYAVLVDGALAHRCFSTWACPRLRQFGYDEGAPLLTDGYTEPAFRGEHLQAFMRRYIVEDILNRGLATKVFNEIRPDNSICQRDNQRAGLRPVARLQGIKVFGLVFRRRATPMSDEAVPEIAPPSGTE